VPLWRPFGTRRVVRIRFEDSPELLRSKGIHYVMLDPVQGTDVPLEQWLERFSAKVVAREPLMAHPEEPLAYNYLIQLGP
jgi:hypothetical protein